MGGLLVTFVGLPGSGKSRLCDEVAGLLRRRGTPCDVSDEVAFSRLSTKFGYILREALWHPRFACSSIRGLLATRQESAEDLVRMTANWLARSFLMRRCEDTEGVHLFDEGMFQALWSIGFSARRDGWQELLPLSGLLLGGPGLTVVVESSLDTVERRLAARPGCGSRLEERLPAHPQVLPQAARVLDVVKDVLARLAAQHPDRHVLVVDNDRDDALETRALEIADCIRQVVNGREVSWTTDRTPERYGPASVIRVERTA